MQSTDLNVLSECGRANGRLPSEEQNMKPTIQMTSTQLPASTITARTAPPAGAQGTPVLHESVAALAMLGLAGGASAVAIPVSNAGFEAPALADGGFVTTVARPGNRVRTRRDHIQPDTAHIPRQAAEGATPATVTAARSRRRWARF